METRREIVMSDNYDHIVRVTNTCPQRISVTICYKGAHEACRRLRLSAYREDTTLLGSMYKQPMFAFDYEESEDK
jgi:hypothetical protein